MWASSEVFFEPLQPKEKARMNPVHPLPHLKPAVLVVDDDESMCQLLTALLKGTYQVHTAFNLSEARSILKKADIQVILLDLKIGDENGFDLLKELKEAQEPVEVIVVTALKEVKLAVQAIQEGAFNYITKDFDDEELIALIQSALCKIQKNREILYLREEMAQICNTNMIFGNSGLMTQIREIVDRVAPLPTTVLILGETGTGKELMARYLHTKSGCSEKPFVSVNVSAIPPELVESILFGHEKGAFTNALRLHLGKFELANGGTLFLDEIGELRLDLQSKLLRVIQEQEIERVGGSKTIPLNVRLIAATNADLKEKVKKKEFRDDLYYRLNVIPIQLPPLRERIEDLPILLKFFMDRYNLKFGAHVSGIQPEVVSMLSQYNWPGNIRELEHLVERMVALSAKDVLGQTDLPIEYQLYPVNHNELREGEDRLERSVSTFERNFLLRMLEETSWNQTLTSKRLGIHRKTLEYKIKKFNLGEIIESERCNKSA